MPEGHSKGKAPKEQAPVIDPVIDPAVRWAEQQKQQADEERRKIDRSKEYLHSVLALERKNGYIEEFWKELRGSIESLVNVPSLWDVPWDSLDEALQQKFMSYAPSAEDLFGVPNMNMTWRIFQRWVWEVIDENFFSKKSKDIIWASPYWEAQAAIERYLQEHNFSYDDEIASHMFPHWRYTTMQFYMSLKDSPRKCQRIDPTCVVPIIAKALGRYFPEEHERDPANRAYSPTLQHLANDVVTMEFYFDANLAVFSHVFHHPITQQTCGFPYSPELEGIQGQAMKAEYGDDSDKGRLVDFVSEPMLQKRGHDYGYDYHVKTAVYPMTVCVAWLEDSLNPPDSPEKEGEEENWEETDEASVKKNEEDDEEEDKEVEGVTKEGKKNKEKADKEEGDKDEEEGIIKEGKKNKKNKEMDEEEEELTKQKEKEKNKKDKSKSKNKGRR
ncbi:uncharacterized protein BKA55DRAFT_575282 [Fusarium redolens]|uniref:Uncharacterized protein n=1 Tax=Fusarium redolens TaxID=48865 RepID=A0A9P9K0J0_FUSRE|nr:uncharacterized protein BKA55DRAFT_575282 [Fusarium redolens]KAH7243673.1 hypothetical protein BKA55DRAFT_575282 [Fusarium redolens]